MKFYKKLLLILGGVVLGLGISLTYPVLAERATKVVQVPWDDLDRFSEVIKRIKSDYVEPAEDTKLLNDAISGMLSGLDPHSAFLDVDTYNALKTAMQGEFSGLGIEVGMEDGLVKVVSPIEDSPAFKAGIKAGDLIIQIDDVLVKGMTLDEAVKKMRGRANTSVKILVLRRGEGKPLQFNIVRTVIKTQSVKYKLSEQNYPYIRITQFQENTGQDLVKILKTIRAENKKPLQGIVLDLRNNPGGQLNSAIAVSSVFLPKDKLVVYTEGRTELSKTRFLSNPDYYSFSSKSDYILSVPNDIKLFVPIVVLINSGSASASEIVAGALQDYKRAVIMGTQSFGKGSVQTVFPMDDGSAIKLTTARYFTPQGRSIQAKGITPDIKVEDPNLPSNTALNIRESDLSHHLLNPSDSPKSAQPKIDTTPTTIDNKPENEKGIKAPIEAGTKTDYQFMQAIEYLKKIQVKN